MAEPDHRDLHITDFPWSPELGDVEVESLNEGSESKLQCNISSYFPDSVTVTWFKKEKGRKEWVNAMSYYNYKISDLRHEKQRDNTYRCTASLVFIPSHESDDGAEFLCRVEHPSLERPIEKKTEPLQVKVFPPRVDDIIILGQSQSNKSVTFQCKIWNFFPDKLTVTWLKKQNGSNDDIPVQTNEHYQIPELTYAKQRDNTYSCMASLVFTPSYESDQGAEFFCRVEHPSLERQIETRTKPLHVKTCPPHVGDIIVPGELRCDQLVVLQCTISGFSPDDLTVTWIKKQKENEEIIESQSQGYYYIPDLRYEKQRDNTYSCTASLVFTPLHELHNGAEFLCRVKHPSLEGLIETGSKPLQLIKTPENLENNRSEGEEGERPLPSDGEPGRGSRGSRLEAAPEMCKRRIKSN